MTAFAEVFGGIGLSVLMGVVAYRKTVPRVEAATNSWLDSREALAAYKEANPLKGVWKDLAEERAKEARDLEEELEELQSRERMLNFKLGLAGRQTEQQDRYRTPPPDEDGPGAGRGHTWENGPATDASSQWEDDEEGPNAGL